jgi:hypothetical protein
MSAALSYYPLAFGIGFHVRWQSRMSLQDRSRLLCVVLRSVARRSRGVVLDEIVGCVCPFPIPRFEIRVKRGGAWMDVSALEAREGLLAPIYSAI